MNNPLKAIQILPISILLFLSLEAQSFSMEDSNFYPLNASLDEFLAQKKGINEILELLEKGFKLNPDKDVNKLLWSNLVYVLNVGIRKREFEILITQLKPSNEWIEYMISDLENINGVTQGTRAFLLGLQEAAAISVPEKDISPAIHDVAASLLPVVSHKKKKERCVVQ